MAYFSICNINGASHRGVDRKTGRIKEAMAEASEEWFIDERIATEAQLDDDFYDRLRGPNMPGDYFARGHLTRREDPNWGTPAAILRANADTFHHSNGCPQIHYAFNAAGKGAWGNLENYILAAATDEREAQRVTVISGPIYDDDNDPFFEDVQIPMAFWKVVARVEDGKLIVFGAMLRQEKDAIEELDRRDRGESAWDWPKKKLSTSLRASVRQIAEATGLDFGNLAKHDIFAGDEALRESGPAEATGIESWGLHPPRGEHAFGKFESIGDFLDAWTRARTTPFPFASSDTGAERRRRPKPRKRAVIEVEATVVRVFADDLKGSRHQHFTIRITEVLIVDEAAKADLADVQSRGAEIHIAARFGDSQGIPDRVPGIVTDAVVRIKGEYIPAEAAYDIGGEDMPVLHFTHDPLGFICNETECYS
jgi:endonuclease G